MSKFMYFNLANKLDWKQKNRNFDLLMLQFFVQNVLQIVIFSHIFYYPQIVTS